VETGRERDALARAECGVRLRWECDHDEIISCRF
jgi:hypothetical protein